MSVSIEWNHLPLSLETLLVEFQSSKDLNVQQSHQGSKQCPIWIHTFSPLNWIIHQATLPFQTPLLTASQARPMSKSWSTIRDFWSKQRCSSSWPWTTPRNPLPEELRTLTEGNQTSLITKVAYPQSMDWKTRVQTMVWWVTLLSKSQLTAIMRMSRSRSLPKTWFKWECKLTTRLLQMHIQRSTHLIQCRNVSSNRIKQLSSFMNRTTWTLCRMSQTTLAKREGVTNLNKWLAKTPSTNLLTSGFLPILVRRMICSHSWMCLFQWLSLSKSQLTIAQMLDLHMRIS